MTKDEFIQRVAAYLSYQEVEASDYVEDTDALGTWRAVTVKLGDGETLELTFFKRRDRWETTVMDGFDALLKSLGEPKQKKE